MSLQLVTELAAVAAGGALGCLSRYGVENMGIFENDKYYYTVAINVSGCMIIGILWALLHHWNADRLWYMFLLTGMLGGYTTYSSFTLDAMELVQQGFLWQALLYISITVVGGLGGCALGLFGTERLLR